MPRDSRQPKLANLAAAPCRPSMLPTIDKITGRVVTALLALIVLGAFGALGAAVCRLLA